MGFKIPTRTVVVTFDGVEDYEGLRIDLRQNVPLGLLFKVQRLSADQTAESGQALAELFAEKVIVGWNVVDENDQPVTCTPENILEVIDLQMFEVIASKWGEAQSPETDTPLAERSPNGAPSEAQWTEMGVS